MLVELPKEIEQLKNLNELYLDNNPLPILPEILGTSNQPEQLISYWVQHQKVGFEKKALNEAKMIVVGQGAVGKTSLVKRLVSDQFDRYESKTEGINIQKWHLKLNHMKIIVNIWDFGGQEIMYATHQFFLTTRSLYILVLNSRKNENQNQIEYWLKIIQSFGGDSPIIVVCNKCDEHEFDIDWSELLYKYPTIVSFVKKVSCKTGFGVEELRKVVQEELLKLEHIQDKLFVSWLRVKKRLEVMDDDSSSVYARIVPNAIGVTPFLSFVFISAPLFRRFITSSNLSSFAAHRSFLFWNQLFKPIELSPY